MNVTQDRAEPERPSRAPVTQERPETARPPVDGDAPPEGGMESDGQDIDALLPVAFDTGAARVAMGQDLADLLRNAEERLDGRNEVGSRPPGEADVDMADVPVPEDVIMLLAEPLESDEEDAAVGTGVAHGSSAGTGADRPATLDGPIGAMATLDGRPEEDLEQPLPRKASNIPRDGVAPGDAPMDASTGAGTLPPEADARPVTAIGRSASSMPPGRGTTSHGLTSTSHGFTGTAEMYLRETTGERSGGARRTGQLERATTGDRALQGDRGAGDRSTADDRAGLERGVISERDRSSERDRHGFGERVIAERGPSIDRGAALIERAAMGQRSPTEKMSARTIERAALSDPSRTPTGKMVSPVASELSDPPRSRARTEASPAVLGPGDAPRALGRAIASRVSGALVLASGDDQRRIVLHDGDVVTAGSTAPVESLVAFLAARGDLDRDLVQRLTGKLPPFGRHAGAALVAHGYLGQDDLWPVLRAHAEWIMGRAILIETGTCELESDPPARYKAEPGVFGGATGAEVFVDTIQRVISPEAALQRLGGYGARLAPGPRPGMLAECALTPEEEDAMRAAPGHTVHEFAGDGPTERWALLFGLVCLEVLDALPAVAAPKKRAEAVADPLDDEALRARVRARLALVEEGDYFALLGVPRSATSYEIRRAYLELRRTFEPSRILTATTADLADDVRLVVEVVEEAYEILRDAPRRERYRRAIEAGPPR